MTFFQINKTIISLFNETAPQFIPSQSCFDWCQEQHFIFYHNLKTTGLLILVAGLLVKSVGTLYAVFAKDEPVEKRLYIKFISDAIFVSIVIGFIFWAHYYLP